MSAAAHHPHRPRRPRRRPGALIASFALAATSLGLWASESSAAAAVPTPDHVVVVVFENHAYGQVIGTSSAPYINSLVAGGADLTSSYAETHPSQPNYYALFSGDTQDVTDDSCVTPGFSDEANLASELIAAGKTWASYNESLPGEGSTVCKSGKYAQKHNPWFGFGNVPTNTAHTMSAFPTDYTKLPTVSFVVPNLCSDMHDCSVRTGDTWLKNNLKGYADWAKTHNSLLLITFDEDNRLSGNRIPTVLYGQPVKAGVTSGTTYNHYDVLRTLEDMYGTTHAGQAANAKDITGIWNS
ncbi:alkaline phosphatase family protein [Streptomyces albireticuli]|uniref:alkaline phosphatase family protein n=1 Tax=Streptomyces albireticuli TaxID=1940 RepID=UPI001E33F6AD|nr:alkaline phosphatase family protein [Streptomyces albireticuli]MCD9141224.1 alkaline phosphatase family protein [Streptomyces albireticuli]MCD9160815.1 alkaline phosphatase family protein [Streptomyces albireticuli]MCD9191128.1 alkaline phosphatase family protein [Streptomyces albireticuli]